MQEILICFSYVEVHLLLLSKMMLLRIISKVKSNHTLFFFVVVKRVAVPYQER